MSVGETRWVVLDGSSSAFEFNGIWNAETDNSSHLSSLWTTTLDGSDMRFRFNGSELVLFGKVKAGGGGRVPSARCTVDGTPTAPDPRATGESFACAWFGEDGDDSSHTLLVNVTIPEGSGNSPSVSIDSLWFEPSFDSSLSGQEALVMYDNNDPHIDFSGNWEPLTDDAGTASVATQAGSSLSVVFTGTSVMWEGWRPVGFGTGQSSGTYSIDGGTPITFNLEPPDPSETTSRHGIWLIVAEDLSPGAHNLTVVYNGPSTPLVLDHLLVKGGNFRIEERPTPPQQGDSASINPSTSASTSPTSLSPSPSGVSPPSRSAPIGAIVGGVLGGLVVALLAIGILIWSRKRVKREKIAQQTSPLPTQMTGPFDNAASAPSFLTPVSAGQATFASTNGAPSTSSYETNTHTSVSPIIYRKGEESVSVSRPGESVEATHESHRHQDSGLRLDRTPSLPPLYTAR
ncbi:hypothetical protein BKA70DRAFT_671150 [Coprinopsis sp. MPI-PUGE-AT-0042]|nr:hypothetical protein BKA70DRAFT_671150 [Coprinopsis sp. MPI-PUGE-AT-0042]